MKALLSKITTPGGECAYRQPETDVPPFVWKTSWHDLVQRVGRHRQAYNATRKAGESMLDLDPAWEARLEHDFCEQNPTLPQMVDGQIYGRYITLDDVKRFFQELKNWWFGGRKKVEQSEAERRAGICATCPYNINVGSCLGCGLTAEFLNLVSGAGSTPHDDKLQHCGFCGCALRALVHWPLEFTTKDEHLPEFCWRKR